MNECPNVNLFHNSTTVGSESVLESPDVSFGENVSTVMGSDGADSSYVNIDGNLTNAGSVMADTVIHISQDSVDENSSDDVQSIKVYVDSAL